jgi:hypothetical protein
MKPLDGRQDAERDARLLAALRHAPDAALEPPLSVSERILAQAHAATQRGATAAMPPWREWLSRTFAPRAPWAAAFGTIAVATLVGLLWSGREPPAFGDSTVPVSTATGSAAAPAALEKASMAPSPVAAEPPAAAAAPRTPAVPAPPAKRQGAKVADAPALERAEQSPRAALPEFLERAKSAVPPAATADASKSPAAAAPLPPQAPPAAAAEGLPSDARAERPALSTNAAGGAAAALREGRVGTLVGRADPSVRVDRALAAAALDAAVWRHDGRIHAHGGEQRLWWSQVGDATQGRWQAATDLSGDLPPAWMVLSIGGERVAAFWFVGDVLWLRDAAGVWRVPVSPAQRRAWLAAPQRW